MSASTTSSTAATIETAENKTAYPVDGLSVIGDDVKVAVTKSDDGDLSIIATGPGNVSVSARNITNTEGGVRVMAISGNVSPALLAMLRGKGR